LGGALFAGWAKGALFRWRDAKSAATAGRPRRFAFYYLQLLSAAAFFGKCSGPERRCADSRRSSRRYQFALIGYVIMPDHVHLLISESSLVVPAKVMQVFKQRVSRRLHGKKRTPKGQLSFVLRDRGPISPILATPLLRFQRLFGSEGQREASGSDSNEASRHCSRFGVCRAEMSPLAVVYLDIPVSIVPFVVAPCSTCGPVRLALATISLQVVPESAIPAGASAASVARASHAGVHADGPTTGCADDSSACGPAWYR